MISNRASYRRTQGGAIIVALITIVILSSVLALTLRRVSSHYWAAFQVASWQEALFAAEAGADIAMVEMRKEKMITGTAFSGWSVVKTNGAASSTPASLASLQTDDVLTLTTTF